MNTKYWAFWWFFFFSYLQDEQPITLSEDTIEDHTAKFRDYLLFGHQKEGLEYAMSHGLWGHALFLASKMDDERSYSQGLFTFSFVFTYEKLVKFFWQILIYVK